MSPDESCPHWTLHNGVCRDCGKRPKIERKPMTPNPDPVAVLRELRAGRCTYSGAQENAALDAAIAALSAHGEARPIGYLTIGKFDGEFSFPPTREYSFKAIQRDLGEGRFSVYRHPAPPGASDTVTEEMVERFCIAYFGDEAWARTREHYNSRLIFDQIRGALTTALAARTGKGEA